MARFRRDPEPPPPDPAVTTVVAEDGAPPPAVEEEEYVPTPPPRPPNLWPWLLLLLLLVAGGLTAAYFLTRDDDKNKQSAPAAVTVPRVVGLKQNAAVQRLNGRGLTPQIVTGKSRLAAGTVFAQDPQAGTEVERRSRVTISVSAVSVTRVPNVVGARTAAAVQRLRTAGLRSQVTSVPARAPVGVVVSTTPKAGASVAKNSIVSLRVSKGQATVPDVVGQLAADARAALRAAGLEPSAFEVPGQEPKGTVTAQKPAGGQTVPRGSKVRINVSAGPGSAPSTTGTTTTGAAQVSVPDVVGLQQSVAQRRLNAAGLRPRVRYVASSKPSGEVVGQSPGGGTSVSRGSPVRIAVSLGPSGTASITVPDIVGQTQQDATTALRDAGFEVQVVTVDTGDPSQNGTVVDEQPGGGARAPQGSVVTIYVNRTA